MQKPASSISRPALTAFAVGLSVAVAAPAAIDAKEHVGPDPEHIKQIVADRHGNRWGSDDPINVLRVSGSGAVAAVQVCDGEVHAATLAGGANAGALLAAGCNDPGQENATMSRSASGAVAATSGGFAITAPAATAPGLPELIAINDALGAQAEREAAATRGHGGQKIGVAMPAIGGTTAVARDRGGRADRGRLARMSRGESGRAVRAGRVARGERAARAGRDRQRDRAAIGGAVTGLPAAGVGPMSTLALDLSLVQAITLAALASAGAGVATLRRRPVTR
jgi:hypothetical protein